MHTDILSICVNGEMSESAEGARLLSEYTSLNLYRGFKSLSLRHQESNSSLCMTLIVCKDCFFYFLKCLQPSRVFSAFPLHTALFTVFFRYFLFWGEADRSVQRPYKRYCTGVLHNGLTSNFDPSIREQGRGLRVSKTGRPSQPQVHPCVQTRTHGSRVFSLRLLHILPTTLGRVDKIKIRQWQTGICRYNEAHRLPLELTVAP